MTYTVGGIIEALDYNTLAALTESMNEVFSDLHSGQTTIAEGADFGYGQLPPLPTVLANNPVLASEWEVLFNSMRNCGTHQGTPVVPPVPPSNPIPGDIIEAFNTPSTMASIVEMLRTNRHNIALGESTVIAGTSYNSATPWLTSLTYFYNVDFGSWNNARHFFNSGGWIGLNGSYVGGSSPGIDGQISLALANMTQLLFSWNATQPGHGGNDVPSIGFYNLTTAYKIIYEKSLGAGYYSTGFVRVSAKYAAAAGTSGVINFRIVISDNDPSPNAKTGTTTYTVNNRRSSGSIVYPGVVNITSGGFTPV